MSSGFQENVTKYAASALFTEKTVPSKFTGSHSTKPGVWGKLLVKEGALDYVVVGPPLTRERIEAHSFAVIEPEVEHRVEVADPVSFQVEFYRAQGEGKAASQRNRAARPLWLTLGTASLGFGAAGTVLPLVPTTPFVLLSAYAFAQSSPRLHRWLAEHRKFGPLISNWQRHRAINRRTKTLAVAVMVLTPSVTWLVGAPVWVLAAQIVVLSGAMCFVVTRPEGDGA